MTRLFTLIIIGIIIGTALGYAIFAQIGDNYIPIKSFISIEENPETLKGVIQSIGDSIEEVVLDMKTRRRNIIIFGLGGGLIGAFFSVLSRKKRT